MQSARDERATGDEQRRDRSGREDLVEPEPNPPSSAPMTAPISGKRATDRPVSVGDIATWGTGMTVRKPMLPAIGPHQGGC